MSESFGAYLKRLREAKSLSIYALSQSSEVSHSYISQIEHGYKNAQNVSPEVIRKLSDAFGVTHIGMMIKAGHVTEEEVLTYRRERGVDD